MSDDPVERGAQAAYQEIKRQIGASSDPEASIGPVENTWRDGAARFLVDGYIDPKSLARAVIEAMPGWQPIESAPKGRDASGRMQLCESEPEKERYWAALNAILHRSSTRDLRMVQMQAFADGYRAGKQEVRGNLTKPPSQ